MLLRHVTLAKFPQHQVAKLNSNTWLQFLDKTLIFKLVFLPNNNPLGFTKNLENYVIIFSPY
ncbi:DUF4381 family protein [Candidatus Marithrix sp. Canyon 246]|uniref:DUF4381 family protein n=1 Tax=Candidatus Marithrix sp. Canyon 246 TaxID=1827136 RepID=UPI00403D5FD0